MFTSASGTPKTLQIVLKHGSRHDRSLGHSNQFDPQNQKKIKNAEEL